jgi:hypothetical protein
MYKHRFGVRSHAHKLPDLPFPPSPSSHKKNEAQYALLLRRDAPHPQHEPELPVSGHKKEKRK